MILEMAGLLSRSDPEVQGNRDERICVREGSQKKETGGSPFAPCEIRRSTKSKNQELPAGLARSLRPRELAIDQPTFP
jgi:hypothetical protein